jgi:hypothetical protein
LSDGGVAGGTLAVVGCLFLFWAWIGSSIQKDEDAHPPDPNARVTAHWSEKGISYNGDRMEYLRRYRRLSATVGVILVTG